MLMCIFSSQWPSPLTAIEEYRIDLPFGHLWLLQHGLFALDVLKRCPHGNLYHGPRVQNRCRKCVARSSAVERC